MAQSNDEENQTDSSKLGDVISQLNSSNESLKTISTNTEIGAEAAIDSSGSINGEVFSAINKSLANIYGAICIELVGVMQKSNDILEVTNSRVKLIMEDIAAITRVIEASADLDTEYSKSESNTSSKIERNTKSISDDGSEEKDITEKVSNDTANQLEHLLSVLKAAGEGNKKFGEKSFDQFNDMIELLKNGEKKDTIKSLLWTKGSQESAKNISKRFSEMFEKTDDIREEEKVEASKELQVELDLGSEFKAAQKIEAERLKVEKDQLTETIRATKEDVISAEKRGNAAEQMQLQGLENAAEAKTPGKEPSKLKAALNKVGAVEPGALLGGMLGKVGGFVTTVMGVIEGISAMTALIGPLLTGLGSLFWPITAAIAIVVGLVDFVMGFIDGFKSTEGSLGDKIIGGIKQGLMTVLDDLLYLIIDLPKKLLSGLMSMLGFEDAAEAIDDFDLTGMIKNLFSTVLDGYLVALTDLLAIPIGIAYDLFMQVTDMFSGSAGDIAKKIGVFLLDIMLLPQTLMMKLAAWVLDMFGFEDIAAKLKDIDIGKTIMAGLMGAVHMITDFFSNAFKGVKVLWDKVKDFDIVASLKEGLAGVIKTLLQPLPFSDKIIKKAFSILGIQDSGGGDSAKPEATSKDNKTAPEVTPSSKAKATALSAPENKISALETPNNSGAIMNAMQSDTQEANSAAQDAPVIVPVGSDGGGSGGSSNTNVSSVSYANNNVPDRTAWQMTPSFGF